MFSTKHCFEKKAIKTIGHHSHIIKGPGKRGHIVAHDVSWAAQTGKHCYGHKLFLKKIRNIFCVPDTKFVSTTNVARVGKRGNICVGNIVSATMCPRLPGP